MSEKNNESDTRATESKLVPFKNRVYGCAIIKSINANYNADFTKQPRTLPNGVVYATDKALKYTIRHYLKQNYSEENILYYTRYRTKTDGEMIPMSLKEAFEDITGAELPKVGGKNKNPKWVLFYYDDKKISGVSQNVTKSKLNKYFNELDEKPIYADTFIEIAEKGKICKIEDDKIEDVSIEEDESFYFYVDKDNKIEKIEIDNETILDGVKEIDLQFFGGYDKIKILKSLLTCIDVRLFGATYTGDTNVSIHGPVQVHHAVDRFIYDSGLTQNLTYTEQIKSPVRNDKAKGGDAEMTTIGTQSRTMEAHYVHNFSINPKNLDDHVVIAEKVIEKKEDSNGNEVLKENIYLSNKDIEKLKEGLKFGATNYDSTAKAGVENELLLWVELNENCKLVLPSFTELISVKRENGKVEIDLTEIDKLLSKDRIKEYIKYIRISFNDLFTKIKGFDKDDTKIIKDTEL